MIEHNNLSEEGGEADERVLSEGGGVERAPPVCRADRQQPPKEGLQLDAAGARHRFRGPQRPRGERYRRDLYTNTPFLFTVGGGKRYRRDLHRHTPSLFTRGGKVLPLPVHTHTHLHYSPGGNSTHSEHLHIYL